MLYSGSGGYLLGLVFVSLGLHMFHKLSRGLEITVADGAEGPQGLFGDLGEGRQAMWCTVAFLGTSHPISGPTCQACGLNSALTLQWDMQNQFSSLCGVVGGNRDRLGGRTATKDTSAG